jgi:hypothetical protein
MDQGLDERPDEEEVILPTALTVITNIVQNLTLEVATVLT